MPNQSENNYNATYASAPVAPPPNTEPVYTQTSVQPPVYNAPQSAPKRGWIVAISIIAAVLILCIVAITSCSSMVASSVGIAGKVSDDSIPSYPCIGIIEMDGEIAYDGSTCSPEGLKAQLDKATKYDNIEAVILVVNSGGGIAAAGEEMAKYVADFEKPIVVVSEATNASAAYEISSQADYIFAEKTTSIGAIGVIMQVTDLSGLYDMLGIKIDSIKSSDAKDSSYGNRALTEEERDWYQHMVDQINEDFIATVAKGRKMDLDAVQALANGLPYTGTDAVDVGLADEVGYLSDAITYLSDQVGSSNDLKTVKLAPAPSELSTLLNLLTQSNIEFSEDDLQNLIEGLMSSDSVSDDAIK